MSNVIPQFVKGDRVRIMQTITMEQSGLANKHGVVSLVHNKEKPYQKVVVRLDAGGGVRLFDNDSLMRET